MTRSSQDAPADRLLTVGQVAEVLGTSERFPRRLIDERLIRSSGLAVTCVSQSQHCASSLRPAWSNRSPPGSKGRQRNG
jgi:hypothetical protein